MAGASSKRVVSFGSNYYSDFNCAPGIRRVEGREGGMPATLSFLAPATARHPMGLPQRTAGDDEFSAAVALTMPASTGWPAAIHAASISGCE
jgi:hypothetical protein